MQHQTILEKLNHSKGEKLKGMMIHLKPCIVKILLINFFTISVKV